MRIREIGAENEKKLLFLPGAISDYSWYELTLDSLKEDWHIYYVFYDGYHAPYEKSFQSVEIAARDIIDYFENCSIKDFDMVYGLSMGGAIANLIYAKDKFKIDILIIDESPTRVKMPNFLRPIYRLRNNLGLGILRKSKWIMKKAYPPEIWTQPGVDVEKDYQETHEFLNRLTFETMKNSYNSALDYEMPKTIPNNDTIIYYLCGEKNKNDMKQFIEEYEKLYPKLIFKIIEDAEHGEFCVMRPKEFSEFINSF